MANFRFPEPGQHTTIIGRTGSGKTQAGAWLLSHAGFDEMPHIIVDYKGDALLNSVGASHHSINDEPPEKPGLYIVKPLPHEEDAVESFLWKTWRKGRAGLFFDEGFIVARSKALETILMQGRSLELSCYICTQRPSWISRYAFSEASHFAVFHLNDRRDRVKVKEFFENYNEGRMPEYHAQWYDVNHDSNFILQPVPDADNIRNRFIERLDEMRDHANQKHFV